MTLRTSWKNTLLVFVCVAAISRIVAADEGVKLCHISNAGFLIEGKETAVLFDAARSADAYGGNYEMPSKALMRDLVAGKGAFSKVRLALVSHKHNDHFDPGATLAHLRSDHDVTYLMPPEAYDMLKDLGLREEEAARVQPVLPPWEGGPLEYVIAGAKVQAFRVDHGPNRPQNIGFRVTLDGVSFFHTGDISASGESLKMAGLTATPVDVMLLAFWYGVEGAGQRAAVAGAWEIGTVVPMHLPPGERSWMAQYGGYKNFLDTIYNQWPGSVRLMSEMDCHTFMAR